LPKRLVSLLLPPPRVTHRRGFELAASLLHGSTACRLLLLLAPLLLPAASQAVLLSDLPAASLQLAFSSEARAGGILDPTVQSNWSWSSPPAGAFVPGAIYERTHAGGGPGSPIGFSYGASFAAFGEFGRVGARSSIRQVGSNGEQSAFWAGAFVGASDGFVVESTTLAQGTPVTVRFDLTVSGVIQGEFPDGSDYASAQLSVDRYVRVHRGSIGNTVVVHPPQTYWDTYGRSDEIRINQTLPLNLALQVGDAVGFDIHFWAGAGTAYNGGMNGPDQEIAARADAMHTLGATIVPTDRAQVQLRFVSGHDYAPAPIPEPQTWALWMCGLVAGAGWLGRRRWPGAGRAGQALPA